MMCHADVSIHAPREGCDIKSASAYDVLKVSIHAPREGCDFGLNKPNTNLKKFQFTHPGRGATPSVGAGKISEFVSIHAPREGCDENSMTASSPTWRFNSRTPGGVRQ